MAHTGTTQTPYTFCGRHGAYWEGGALYHMKHRYYRADLARFLSADPIGISGGINLYAYANGNPVLFLDALGLCSSGSDYIQGYINDLRNAGLNIDRIGDAVEQNDIRTFNRNGEYEYRGEIYRADQMGNIGPGYAMSEIYGPLVSAVSMLAAEVAFPREGGYTTQDAVGSLHMNLIGIIQERNDNLEQNSNYFWNGDGFLDSTPP